MIEIFDIKGTLYTINGFDHYLTISDTNELKTTYQGNLLTLSYNFVINKGIDEGYFIGEKINIGNAIESGRLIKDVLLSSEHNVKMCDLVNPIFDYLKKEYQFDEDIIELIKLKIL